jgi:hypothetical protein
MNANPEERTRMSAAANAAAFLSMRRRLPENDGPKPHFAPPPVTAPAEPRPVRVAAVETGVQVTYRKRRSIQK